MLSGELPGGQGVSKTSCENQPLQRPGLDLQGVIGPSHNPPACGGGGREGAEGFCGAHQKARSWPGVQVRDEHPGAAEPILGACW